jgi:3-phenylpropionate/trans-cinnamate dioxygenase ferredoxin reductase subunit
MTNRTLAIVGASVAGAKAAEAARNAGYDGRIVLIGDEAVPPYERPPLSKAVLRGEAAPVSARVHPDGFYEDHDIELVTGRVAGLDTGARRVELAAGDATPNRAAWPCRASSSRECATSAASTTPTGSATSFAAPPGSR